MNVEPNSNHHVRRVVLPSGKTIEVVYFRDAETAHAIGPSAEPSVEELHRCPECETDLVYPVQWEEAGSTHWEVSLRCPNCEWAGGGVFGQDLVERFDEELDRGTESLVRDLRRLMHANMEEEIDRFINALRDDHILPMDF